MFVEVALDLPLERTFYYRVSKNTSFSPSLGKRVIVPFGSRDLLRTGVIVSIREEVDVPVERVKEVFDIPDDFSLFTEKTLKLCQWIAEYYCCSLGEVLFSFLPSSFEITEALYVQLRDFSGVKLSPAEEKIVEVLKAKGRVKLSILKRLVRISVFYQAVRSLLQKGVIVGEEAVKRDSIPRERFLVLRKEEEVKGPKARVLLEILKDRGKIAIREVKTLGISPSVISRLEKRGIVGIVEEEVTLKNKPQVLEDKRDVQLTPSQKRAFDSVVSSKKGVFVLQGVTGSGKMEVYLKIASEVVRRGKSVLVLVPELMLTPELRARVESYFGNNIGFYHGKLTPREKASTWLKAVRGETSVFIGTRSAVLLPIKNLGLIVVDEEQDSSYKEQQKPYYHARAVSIKRGEIEEFPVLLVSATPSVETFYMAKRGLYKRLELKERVSTVPLPYVKLVNLQEAERVNIFSRELLAAIENTVKKGEQVLLFINRRGFFSQAFCPNCGFISECDDCAVPLVYHKSERKLICHICGKRYRPIYRCPVCGTKLEFKGYGTERVEEEIRILFPGFRVVRIDQDTVKDPSRAAQLIKEIKSGSYDIVVGTQIAIKGHNFPKLTLVGILIADLLGAAPDFMTSERIFQTIVHATGRAGRFKPGAAIVQAFKPELPAVKYAVEHKYEEFYEEELLARKLLNYPPFTKGVLLEFQVDSLSSFKSLNEKFESIKEKLSSFFSVPDLSPAPIPRVSGRYRFISFLRTNSEEKLMEGNVFIKDNFPKHFRNVRFRVEVDPVKVV